MSRQLLLVTAVIALAALLAGPGVAAAGTASTRTITFGKPDTGSGYATIVGLRYEAGRGERNGLRVEVDPRGATLTDRVRIRAGRGCRRVPGRGPRTVRCSFRGAQGLDGGPDSDGADEVRARVRLHDGRDRAVVTGDFPGDVPGSSSEGTPSFMTMEGGRGSDRMRAGADFGLFIGGPGNDRMSGGDGADRFHEGRRRNGADTISGGSNPPFVTPDDGDRVTYGKRRQRVVADLAGDRDDGAPGERDRIGDDIEILIGGFGSNRLTGNDAANIIASVGGRRDVIDGRAGPDELSTGADTGVVRSRDGENDEIGCADGRVRALADGYDINSRCALERDEPAGALVDLTPDASFEVRDNRNATSGSPADVTFIVECPRDASPASCSGRARLIGSDSRTIGETDYDIRNDGDFGSLVVALSEAERRRSVAAGDQRATLLLDAPGVPQRRYAVTLFPDLDYP